MVIEKAVFEQLSRLVAAETVILTIGNTLKGDDGAGPAVYQRLGTTKICGSAGDIRIFRTEQLDSVAASTHTLSPHLFIEMIRAQIEVAVCFIGIQPGQTGLGEGLSGPVEEAVAGLADVLAEVFGPQ